MLSDRLNNTPDIPEEGRGGPLAGVRVLDLSSVVMGPYATQQLGDLGADVITVEPIGGGMNRRMGGGLHPDFSGIALNLLRNKRSACLDLADEEVRSILLKIAATCDVVVTNLRPKSLERMGFSYEDVRSVRDDIVYCQAQGFRSDSTRADEPAYDDVIQAESGIADAAYRVTGMPQLAPTIMADKVCGLAIAGAVTAALFYRQRTGRGQRVEVPMLDVMRAFVLVEHGSGAIADSNLPAGYSRVLSPERGPQQTLDGWINILPYSTKAYNALFAAGRRDDLVDDPRTQGLSMMVHANFLYSQLRPIIAERTTADWLAFCREHEIPVGEIANLDVLVAQMPRVTHPVAGPYRHLPHPVRYSETDCETSYPAPEVGEHTRAVLLEAGLTPSDVAQLVERGVAYAL